MDACLLMISKKISAKIGRVSADTDTRKKADISVDHYS